MIPAGVARAQASCDKTAGGYFTSAQAALGKNLYENHCAQCHADDLKGNAGPALAGPDFESYLKFSKISAKQLLTFMRAQMPYQDPGSLKPQEYEALFAYILQTNGYPSSPTTALTPGDVSCIEMLPYPAGK